MTTFTKDGSTPNAAPVVIGATDLGKIDELTAKILAVEAWQANAAYRTKKDRSAELAKLHADRDALVAKLK